MIFSRRLIGSLAALAFALAIAALSALLLHPVPEQAGGSAQSPGRFVPAAKSQPLPLLAFTDGAGNRVELAGFAGKVVLLNLWATWCAPCVREMPSLDRLQASLGGADFQVVALAEDRGGAPVVMPFLEKLGLKALHPYMDAPGAATAALSVRGLPMTVLVSRDGRELGRMLGGTDWDSPAAHALIERLIAEGGPER